VMRAPKKKATAAKLRNWRVSILRNRARIVAHRARGGRPKGGYRPSLAIG